MDKAEQRSHFPPGGCRSGSVDSIQEEKLKIGINKGRAGAEASPRRSGNFGALGFAGLGNQGLSLVSLLQTRMQSLQPDPKAQYRSVYEALKKMVLTEGFWRPLRGINVTMLGAGPAHALYFACYEKMKKSLSDIFQPGGNSHLANGIFGVCPKKKQTHL